MNLRDVYIDEVTSRIPESMRQDVALELESTIDDMTGNDPSETALFEALRQLGDPHILAARYANRPLHLIGPALFTQYVNVIKIVLPIAVTVITILSVIGYLNNSIDDTSWLPFLIQAFLQVGAAIFNVVVQTLFWITLTFFIIERAVPEGEVPFSSWKPEQLKKVKPRSTSISFGSILFDFVATVLMVVLYVNAEQMIRVVMNGKSYPLLNPSVLDRFLPFVIALAVFGIAIAIYKWMVRHWTKPLALWNALFNVVWIVVTALILLQPDLISSDAISLIAAQISIDVETISRWGVRSVLITVTIVCIIDLAEGLIKAFRR
ncbi:hypothetical protein PTI97_00210 [Exiguobacterium marinum]|uniref:Uncharacterized protein n=1 Tax=Exiguobacterium marinum TaxID=273528 RepID=A0ABY7X093_9BACL|nr:hypothetical protein [Exiguobacterium marinum]WDH75992.1 hypothetical protein PTI97_00210 [Exiguobacterium marinum]